MGWYVASYFAGCASVATIWHFWPSIQVAFKDVDISK